LPKTDLQHEKHGLPRFYAEGRGRLFSFAAGENDKKLTIPLVNVNNFESLKKDH